MTLRHGVAYHNPLGYCIQNTAEQRFPIFFHLRTPWQPISINCTLHISKTFVFNIVAVISNSYFVTVTLRCVIPVVSVTNEREESVVNQHNHYQHIAHSSQTLYITTNTTFTNSVTVIVVKILK